MLVGVIAYLGPHALSTPDYHEPKRCFYSIHNTVFSVPELINIVHHAFVLQTPLQQKQASLNSF